MNLVYEFEGPFERLLRPPHSARHHVPAYSSGLLQGCWNPPSADAGSPNPLKTWSRRAGSNR